MTYHAANAFIGAAEQATSPKAVKHGEVEYPIGCRYAGAMDVADINPYTPERFAVIGEIEHVPVGNAILRIGRTLSRTDHSWVQELHLVLTPAERDRLIADLTPPAASGGESDE